jgi:GLPGLI family protein
MKNCLLVVVFIALSGGLQAQNFISISKRYVDLEKYSTIDSAYLKCAYRLTYLPDSLNLEWEATDKQVLLIGKTISKYYSQLALDYNQYVKKYVKRNEAYPSSSDGSCTYEVFKNYPQDKETVMDIGTSLGGNYRYEEPLPVFEWKITNEKQVILSYLCQKATATFRGRDYIAWFTMDIPIDNGPWKFGGLPGLILKLSDTKNNFVYECDGLEQLKNKEPIRFYKVDYTKLKRRELDKLYRWYHEDRANYRKLRGTITMETDEKTKKTKVVEHSSYKIPYNPIELE